MAIFPVPKFFDGRVPTISSRYKSKNPSRPTHDGVDIMYPREAKDGGAPGKTIGRSCAPRFMMPDRKIPALAFADGRVSISKDIGTGGYIKIEHANGLSTQYMHLRDRKVSVGDTVREGQPVGLVSHDPRGGVNHLHFQARVSGSLVDPETLLQNARVVSMPGSLWWKLGLAVAGGIGLYWVLTRAEGRV